MVDEALQNCAAGAFEDKGPIVVEGVVPVVRDEFGQSAEGFRAEGGDVGGVQAFPAELHAQGGERGLEGVELADVADDLVEGEPDGGVGAGGIGGADGGVEEGVAGGEAVEDARDEGGAAGRDEGEARVDSMEACAVQVLSPCLRALWGGVPSARRAQGCIREGSRSGVAGSGAGHAVYAAEERSNNVVEVLCDDSTPLDWNERFRA
jgi:hypothetical protein